MTDRQINLQPTTCNSFEPEGPQSLNGLQPECRGFTLIELLLVMAIIGIMSGIVLSNWRSSQSKNRDTLRISDVQTIAAALRIYQIENKTYPKSLSGLVPGQLSALPLDPLSSSSTPIMYSYAAIGSKSDCTGYHLGTTLENEDDKSLKSDSDAAPSKNICAGSEPDFSGIDSASCSASMRGSCYDVKK